MDFEKKVRKIKIKSPGRKESRRFFYDEVKWLDFSKNYSYVSTVCFQAFAPGIIIKY